MCWSMPPTPSSRKPSLTSHLYLPSRNDPPIEGLSIYSLSYSLDTCSSVCTTEVQFCPRWLCGLGHSELQLFHLLHGHMR